MMSDSSPDAIERIADLLYARQDHGSLVTSGTSVVQQVRLVHLLQDILEHLVVEANRTGKPKAAEILKDCRVNLDRVNITLESAAKLKSSLNMIEL